MTDHLSGHYNWPTVNTKAWTSQWTLSVTITVSTKAVLHIKRYNWPREQSTQWPLWLTVTVDAINDYLNDDFDWLPQWIQVTNSGYHNLPSGWTLEMTTRKQHNWHHNWDRSGYYYWPSIDATIDHQGTLQLVITVESATKNQWTPYVNITVDNKTDQQQTAKWSSQWQHNDHHRTPQLAILVDSTSAHCSGHYYELSQWTRQLATGGHCNWPSQWKLQVTTTVDRTCDHSSGHY